MTANPPGAAGGISDLLTMTVLSIEYGHNLLWEIAYH